MGVNLASVIYILLGGAGLQQPGTTPLANFLELAKATLQKALYLSNEIKFEVFSEAVLESGKC